MKKPFVNPKDKDDIVFYSGVGYKKVPVRQSFDDIDRKNILSSSAVKDTYRSAVTSNAGQKSPPKYKNLVQMMEPDDINHLMTYSPTNQQSKIGQQQATRKASMLKADTNSLKSNSGRQIQKRAKTDLACMNSAELSYPKSSTKSPGYQVQNT